jgi:hypothetical protein
MRTFGENYTRRPNTSCKNHWKKIIGKSYSGGPNTRFDDEELEIDFLDLASQALVAGWHSNV